jgi:hypothetical protein
MSTNDKVNAEEIPKNKIADVKQDLKIKIDPKKVVKLRGNYKYFNVFGFFTGLALSYLVFKCTFKKSIKYEEEKYFIELEKLRRVINNDNKIIKNADNIENNKF